ncbi:hypothetical protein Pmani_031828 [Petrolisthes manimaculis]|uniref:Uncharacterized protein n=1 Tax=Petrolisthes manimaculis TaxID=1843537 RepID=A0AAE1TS04_9EUCA|nr:hypothetical protein Pmani_031828 [Petrolisthes manimaculis]
MRCRRSDDHNRIEFTAREGEGEEGKEEEVEEEESAIRRSHGSCASPEGAGAVWLPPMWPAGGVWATEVSVAVSEGERLSEVLRACGENLI